MNEKQAKKIFQALSASCAVIMIFGTIASFVILAVIAVNSNERSDRVLLERGAPIIGTVADTDIVDRKKHATHYYYVYIAYEPNGTQYTHVVRSTSSSLLDRYALGQKVNLVYDPQDPDNVDFSANITEEEIQATKKLGYTFLPIALALWLFAILIKVIWSMKDGKINFKSRN